MNAAYYDNFGIRKSLYTNFLYRTPHSDERGVSFSLSHSFHNFQELLKDCFCVVSHSKPLYVLNTFLDSFVDKSFYYESLSLCLCLFHNISFSIKQFFQDFFSYILYSGLPYKQCTKIDTHWSLAYFLGRKYRVFQPCTWSILSYWGNVMDLSRYVKRRFA
jgi:hypothetical protein